MGCLSQAPARGTEPSTFQCWGWLSNPLSHTASAEINHFKVHDSVAFGTLHGWATTVDFKF